MIPVTKPFLPPIHEYEEYIKGIWERNWLTNDGPLVKRLENELVDSLDLKNLLFVSNGTIALQMALKALNIAGEVITTPFSYVATTSSLVWEGITPVFSDIDAKTFNIDPQKIESKITAKTTAILATHVYGNPCDIEAIQEIADKHGLKIIYDAAHCFGTMYKGKSVLSYGDISTISFHATKLFHTTEGGAVITNDDNIHNKLFFLRNFGHNGPDKFKEVGINGKNSEFHAAMGICNLKYVAEILEKRKKLHTIYDELLIGAEIEKPAFIEGDYNYSYYPILFNSNKIREAVFEGLANEGVFARKYFYPLLTKLNYVEDSEVPVAESIADRILCLPMYHDITEAEIGVVSQLVQKIIND